MRMLEFIVVLTVMSMFTAGAIYLVNVAKVVGECTIEAPEPAAQDWRPDIRPCMNGEVDAPLWDCIRKAMYREDV